MIFGLASPRTKRALDVLVAATGLLAFAPFGVVVTLILRFGKEGRVLHRSPRLGCDRRAARLLISGPGSGRLHDAGGRPFERLRFCVLGREVRMQGRRPGEHPQLTRLGRLLRRTGFERWPELWCVLRGEMSAVGPRAPTLDFQHCLAEHCPEWNSVVGLLRPGLLTPRGSHAPRSRSLMARLVEDRLQCESYLRLMAEASPLKTLWHDLLTIASSLRPRPVVNVGNSAIRLDYPHRFSRLELNPAELCRSTPAEQGAEVLGTSQGFTAWWYPPRHAEAFSALPRRDEVLDALASRWSLDDDGALRAELDLPGASGKGEDEICVDMPSALHELHHVADHLMPLFEAAGRASGDKLMATRLGMLLLEMCCSVPAGAEGRRLLRLRFGDQGLRLDVSGREEEVSSRRAEAAFPARLLASVGAASGKL